MMNFFWVGLGGALGAIARYALGMWVYEHMGTRFPYGTFTINVTGCFIIGLTLTIIDLHLGLPEAWRLAVIVGFIGAYTTFSTFEYETVRAVQHGNAVVGLLYLVVSVVAGYAAVWLGTAAGRAVA